MTKMGNYTNYHITLASYFQIKPLYLDELTQKKPNTRKLVEQPWQQTKGEMWDEVSETLCNLNFIQAKAAARMTYVLLQDFRMAEDIIIERKIQTGSICSISWNQWKDFIMRESEVFLNFAFTFPQTVFQQAYNTLYHPEISKHAKELENSGNAPNEPWFKIYELEPYSLPYLPPLVLRKPINDKRNLGYQYITALEVINPDCIVTGFLDGSIAVWDVKTGIRIHHTKAHSWMVHCVLPLSKETFATSGDDGIIRVWNISESKWNRELHGHTSKVLCLKKWKDQLIISGSTDTTIRIWDLNKVDALMKILPGHNDIVNDLIIIKSRYLISISADKTLGFWDLNSSTLLVKSIKYTKAEPHSISISPEELIFSYGVDCILCWGTVNDIFNRSFINRLINRGEQILPRKRIEIPGIHFKGCVWLSKNEFIILDHGKILTINTNNNKVTNILDQADPDLDLHLGLLKINSATMLSWNQKGSIWRWNLTSMKREKIAVLANGEPARMQLLDDKTVLVGTNISEEIYLVDIYPEKMKIQSPNCIISGEYDFPDYPIVNHLRDKLQDCSIQSISNEELKENMDTSGSEPNSSAAFEPVNYRRFDWERNGKPLSTSNYLDLRNFFIYYVKDGTDCTVLPGTFIRCTANATRFPGINIEGRKHWIELINA